LSSVDTRHFTGTARFGMPPFGSKGSGASLVHSTVLVLLESPDATPSENGLLANFIRCLMLAVWPIVGML